MALLGTNCSGDSPDPTGASPTVTGLSLVSGNSQTGEVGAALDAPILVRATDQNGHPMPDVSVAFVVNGGRGRVESATVFTDADGLASTTWVMGPELGTNVQTATARVVGAQVASVRFSATATLSAGTLSKLAGDSQTAQAGGAVAVRPTVLVKTPGPAGVPVAGVIVNWAVTTGGGVVQTGTARTDRYGMAAADWVLGGTEPGRHELSASVPGLSGAAVTFQAISTGPPASVAVASGDRQTGVVDQILGERAVVRVLDAWNNPVPGVTVYWVATGSDYWGASVLSGNGARTNRLGEVQATIRLGPFAGTDQVEAYTLEIPAPRAVFTFTSLPGPAVSMSVHSGQYQTAVVGTTLPEPVAVLVTDSHGNPTAGATVHWWPSPGSGSTAVSSSVTGADGIASTAWTIGSTVGVNNQLLQVSLEWDFVGLSFVASASAGP